MDNAKHALHTHGIASEARSKAPQAFYDSHNEGAPLIGQLRRDPKKMIVSEGQAGAGAKSKDGGPRGISPT